MKMLVELLVNLIKKYNPEMSEAQLETRRFGLVCLLADGSKLLLYLGVFTILGLIHLFLVSFFVYTGIRIITGGYHARTYWGCFAISLIIFLFILGMGSCVELSNVTCCILIGLSLIFTFILAPVSHPNRPFKQGESKKRYKIISSIIILFYGLISQILPIQFKVTVILSIVMATILEALGLWLNNGASGEMYE